MLGSTPIQTVEISIVSFLSELFTGKFGICVIATL